jgi:hypothetical protein
MNSNVKEIHAVKAVHAGHLPIWDVVLNWLDGSKTSHKTEDLAKLPEVINKAELEKQVAYEAPKQQKSAQQIQDEDFAAAKKLDDETKVEVQKLKVDQDSKAKAAAVRTKQLEEKEKWREDEEKKTRAVIADLKKHPEKSGK